MAPEQFDDATNVDVRADIYSFGVMLFEMTTGRLPFEGRTRNAFEHLHKTQPPPALSNQPSALNNMVQTCLAKKPTYRFSDFGEVRQQLADIYKTVTGESAPEPVVGEELEFWHWNSRGLSLGNLGRYEEQIACYERALALHPSSETVGVDTLWFNRGNAVYRLGRVEESIACYDRALASPNLYSKTVIAAWGSRGNALATLGRFEEAIACYNRSLVFGSRDARGWLNKGSALGALGRHDEAIACYDHVIDLNSCFVEAWLNKGNALEALGRHVEAISCYSHARAVAQENGDRVVEGSATGRLGLAYQSSGDKRRAIKFFEQYLAIAREIGDRNAQATALSNLGNAHYNLGDAEQAIPFYRQHLVIVQEIGDRAVQRDTLGNLGNAYADLGAMEQAIDFYQQHLAIAQEIGDRWGEGIALGNLGLAYRDLGDVEQAIGCYQQSLAIAREVGNRESEAATLNNDELLKNPIEGVEIEELYEGLSYEEFSEKTGKMVVKEIRPPVHVAKVTMSSCLERAYFIPQEAFDPSAGGTGRFVPSDNHAVSNFPDWDGYIVDQEDPAEIGKISVSKVWASEGAKMRFKDTDTERRLKALLEFASFCEFAPKVQENEKRTIGMYFELRTKPIVSHFLNGTRINTDGTDFHGLVIDALSALIRGIRVLLLL